MLDRLNQLQRRYEEIEQMMARADVATDRERLMTLARERASLEKVVEKYRHYQAVDRALADTTAMLQSGLDQDMTALAKEEIAALSQKRDAFLEDMKLLMISPEPNDEKDVIMEIRAGTGGEEAALFAADLYRMYARYALSRGWDVEVIDVSESGLGAYKEMIFEIRGKGAFSKLKYERGVHRVQRVPATEASGRIHTSTATVAVLPKAEDVEVTIRPEDIKMDFYHASGAGGQNVNKLSTAVRLTHLPTGMVSTCQDERSQLKNRQKAMAVLRARLFDIEQRKQTESITEQRRAQVGTGERAEKIRTYNFPQDRLTDHRLNVTFHNLPHIMEGNLDEVIEALAATERGRQLEETAV